MTKTMSELAIFIDMMSKGFPVDPVTVIDKLDISETEKSRWKKYIEENKQAQQQGQQAAQQAQQAEAQAKIQIETQKLQLKSKDLELKTAKEQADIQTKAKQVQIQGMKAQADAQAKRTSNLLKFRELAAAEKESQRDWVLALSQDERDNLNQDLSLLGIVNAKIANTTKEEIA